MSVELWAARLERPLTEREAASILPLLPPKRRERLLRVRQAERRREPLLAYLILRRALWEQYHWREFPEIARSSRGKPYFPAHPGVHFNLSHTGGAVLAALAGKSVGVDIEKIRPLSPRAMGRLADMGEGEAFFQNWVRREARAKRTGEGIASMLRGEAPLQPGEVYYELDAFPGYASGAAASGGEPLGKLRRYTIEELLP